MRSDLEKYIGYYLLVYLVILSLYGFIEYIVVCNGDSLACKFSFVKIKEVLITIASILTPIIALIIFLSWKSQFNKNLDKDYLTDFLEVLRLFHNSTNPIFLEIRNTSSYLEVFKEEKREFYYLKNFNLDEILSKINCIDTIASELFYENIGIRPYLLDISYRAIYIVKHIEKIKNENDLEERFHLLNCNFKMVYLPKYEKSFNRVSIEENFQESITRLQYDYLNLISEIKKLRKA